ncbi:hybrid sensor histidine kinase/response regulator [Hydrogenophaga pseudoflava]|uniref:hybrid sensor histidine kinase/response regulator n=1 Tax=Hydrogenophaga pseudoflava TaxID=47421 RepID=UPI0027E478A1|nr:ATP-binding protein [Hydrogenophaga pseudoflava]MDQ7744378.1 ATP-binding protein [Hydrogenophaga pseudoflava]
MPTTIRSRLLLLMLAVLLPAIAAALIVIARTYQSEREAVHRGLRDNASAVAQVLDRELTRRADIARAMSSSYILAGEPLDDRNLRFLHGWTSGIVQDLGGWIELRSATEVLLDTRLPAPSPPRPLHLAARGLALAPVVRPLVAEPPDGALHVQVVQPVQRQGRTVLNLVIAVPQDTLQRLIDQQDLPPDWVGTVLDDHHRVMARHPGGVRYVGRTASPDMVRRIQTENETVAPSVSLDGQKVLSSFSKTPQGWSYVVAAPRDHNPIFDEPPLAVVQLASGALLLLAVAVAAASWVARGIARATESLKAAAQSMRAGAPEPPAARTGIVEFDEVGQTMSCTAQALATARGDLERKVEEAVVRTRLAEQRVSQAQRIAALGRLTGGVAHDFNNLLGVVSNSAHLIRRHVEQLPGLQMPLEVIQRAVEMGSHLSQQLLRFGGRQAVSPRPVELGPYLADLREMLQMVAREKVTVSVDVAPGTEPVNVDPSELELALINLALNARDAITDRGWLRVEARTALTDETEGLPPGRYVLLTVSDNGAGMDEAQAAQVFEPFFTTKGVGQGTGLGLSQVHGFCQQAGGMAGMSSTPGLGSTVSMVLPAASAGTGASADHAPLPAPAPVPQHALDGMRVLLVEDGNELATVTTVLLESYGAQVQRAGNVEQAQARVHEDASIQVVLSDVVMPGKRNGVDLARLLRRSHPGLPVVLISGYSNALAGLDGFTVLRKPVDPDVLVRTLLAALRHEQAPPAPADGA